MTLRSRHPARNIVRFPAGKTQLKLPSDITVFSLIPYSISATFADPLVRVTINGKSMDMLLDSSENGMALDDETAKQLGLTTYGPYDKDEKGHPYPTRSVIPSLEIGDLEMSNVVVKCRHMNMFEGNGRPVVGVLGYDFLANTVVEIDYVNHDVMAVRSCISGACVFTNGSRTKSSTRIILPRDWISTELSVAISSNTSTSFSTTITS